MEQKSKKMKMFSNLKAVKKYYKLAGLRAPIVVAQFLLLLVPALLSIYTPVLTAHVISALTVFDFEQATRKLWLNLAIIFACAVLYFVFWIFNNQSNKTISLNFNKFLYENVQKNEEISSIGLQTILNTRDCIDFNRVFLFKLCYFVKSVIVLGIIFFFNSYIALAIIFVSILSYGLFYLFDSRIQKINIDISKNENEKMFLFNSIKAGKTVETDFNLSNVMEDKYFALVQQGNKLSKKASLLKTINEHFVSLILKSAVIVLTVYLVGLIKETFLTLSLYLILTPYLTSSAQNLISFLDVFSNVGHIDNVLLDFSALKKNEETINSTHTNFYTYNLYFYHLSSKISHICHLQDLNLKIEYGKFAVFVQKEFECKNLILNILKRTDVPSSGSVLLDGKDISSIDEKTYQALLSFTNTKPYFFDVSIRENLLLVCNSPKHICKSLLGLHLKEKVDKLPQKINTKIQYVDDKLLYFLGIARAYISGSKILCINEIPSNFVKADFDLLKKVVGFLKGKMTVLLFSSSDFFSKNADLVFYLEKGKIKAQVDA